MKCLLTWFSHVVWSSTCRQCRQWAGWALSAAHRARKVWEGVRGTCKPAKLPGLQESSKYCSTPFTPEKWSFHLSDTIQWHPVLSFEFLKQFTSINIKLGLYYPHFINEETKVYSQWQSPTLKILPCPKNCVLHILTFLCSYKSK